MIILVDKPQAVAGMRAGALSELTGTAVPCGAQSLLRTAWEQTWSDNMGPKLREDGECGVEQESLTSRTHSLIGFYNYLFSKRAK